MFTAGATESNNLALFGTRSGARGDRRRIVTSAIEHKAVLGPCQELEKQGFEVVVLPVEADGTVDLEAAKEAINNNTLLVSVQAANNEIGTIQPIAEGGAPSPQPRRARTLRRGSGRWQDTD